MAVTQQIVSTVAAEKTHSYLDSRNLWLMVAGFTFFNLFVRWYEEVYGWSAGLDAFAPEFKTYWMTWLYIETALYIPLFAAIGAYLWKTRVRDMDGLTSQEVLTNHFHHLVWLVAYGIAIYWGASFYTEQDGTWHQTVVRDTDFTPSHIIEFYMSYPIYILTGWGAFMYARTRIPCFSKGVSLPYLVVVVGPFMILPNVGLNEWGHTFWWMEELFVAPLHYGGFVFFGWMALGLCGLLLQIFEDIGNLVGPTLMQAADYDEYRAPVHYTDTSNSHLAGESTMTGIVIPIDRIRISSFLIILTIFALSLATGSIPWVIVGALATVAFLIREGTVYAKNTWTKILVYTAGVLLTYETYIFATIVL